MIQIIIFYMKENIHIAFIIICKIFLYIKKIYKISVLIFEKRIDI